MIGKQTKGRGFRGALNYLLGKDGAQLIGGNMIGDNPRDLAAEFGEVRKLRPKLERAVYHASLSLPPGEALSDEQWNAVAARYTGKMGFGGSQFVVVRHRDTAHDHVHILASRVRLDGSVVPESHDYRRSELAIRGIERDFGLARVAPSREADRRAPTTGELRKGLREGRPSTKYRMQGLVAAAAEGQPTATEFIDRLERSGVQVIPHLASTGRVSGISFSLDGERMKGSDLGRGFSWASLQTKGVQYEQNRDLQRFREARARFDEAGEHGVYSDRHGGGRGGAAPGEHQHGRRLGETPGAGREVDVGARGRSEQGGGRLHRDDEQSQRGSGARQGVGGRGEAAGRSPHRVGDGEARRSAREVDQAADAAHGSGRAAGGPVVGERLLRMAESLLRPRRDGRELGMVQQQGLPEAGPTLPNKHSADLEIIKRALKPIDDEKEKEALEKERVRKERAKSRGKSRGPSIDL